MRKTKMPSGWTAHANDVSYLLGSSVLGGGFLRQGGLIDILRPTKKPSRFTLGFLQVAQFNFESTPSTLIVF